MRYPLALTLAPILYLTACSDSENLIGPGSGTLQVTTATTGAELDLDGYSFQIDGGANNPISSSTTVSTNLPAGSHTIQLTGLADGCTVADNPRSVSVAGGQTSTVTFAVACAGATGSLTVITATAGPSPDADGYGVTLDGTDRGALPVSGSLTFADLPSGPHTIGLNGIAANCHLEGDNPRSLTVAAGSTAEVSLTVMCTTGALVWRHLDTGTDYLLQGIWGTSGSDLFTVGQTSAGDPTSGILHFDGQRWTAQLTVPNQRLQGVWGSGPADVFAVGFNSISAGPGGLIYHYDGSSWTQKEDPPHEEPIYASVWGASGSNVWAVGENFVSRDEVLISHFDGSSWTADPFNSGGIATDVYGTAANNVYLTAYSFLLPGTAVLRYDGSSWSSAGQFDGEAILFGVWASSPSDVFAVGRDGNSGFIVHYDGRTWSRMEVPPTPDGLADVWGSSSSDVYAVGAGTILHYDGSGWSQVSAEGGTDVFGFSATDVYVVGGNGKVLHGTP